MVNRLITKSINYKMPRLSNRSSKKKGHGNEEDQSCSRLLELAHGPRLGERWKQRLSDLPSESSDERNQ
jgi:hypothetical protein